MPQVACSPDALRRIARNRIGTGPFVLVSFDGTTPYLLSEGMRKELWSIVLERMCYITEKTYGIAHEIREAMGTVAAEQEGVAADEENQVASEGPGQRQPQGQAQGG